MNNALSRWKQSLARSKQGALGRFLRFFDSDAIDSLPWDELEMLLLQSDVGAETAESILDTMRSVLSKSQAIEAASIRLLLEEVLHSRLSLPPPLIFDSDPYIILVVGVNGSGKTTSIAKLAFRFSSRGKRVLLVGADTFRAAAKDQLQLWAEKLDIPIIAGEASSDAGAVVFDGIKSAISRKYEIVLIDTAGRMHTRSNLMEELCKVHRVAGKALVGAPHAVWLVVDATMGQNALAQARAFTQAIGINGIILAKLDTSSKGGMVFAIQEKLGIPILFAGLGEKPEDLYPFDPDAFVKGITST